MSYFDFFCKNIEKSDVISGTCNSFCPPEEETMRENAKLVHILEVSNCTKKLVKSYTRSAADKNLAVPRLLRPYSVLVDTVRYLLFEVTKRTDVPQHVIYDYVNDRLRAVRQDITVQRLPPDQCARLLDPMVRFHVFYSYQLCELPLKDFDPVLNKKYLLECLKWFLASCDAAATQLQKNDLTGTFSMLSVNNSNQITCNQELMENLYIMCNLDSVHPLLRYLSLPKSLKSAPSLRLAYRTALQNLKGNYIGVCRSLDRLCPLTYCALSVYLPEIQRRSIEVLSHAYSSKQLSVPVERVRTWLRFTSDAHAAAACAHYGLHVRAGQVRFARGSLRKDAVTLAPRKCDQVDGKLDLGTDYIFSYH